MKNLIVIMIACIVLASCKKETVTPMVTPADPVDTTTVVVVDTTSVADSLREKIFSVTYPGLVTPTIKKVSTPNILLPSKTIMFDGVNSNGEFSVSGVPDTLYLLFSGKKYVVDSVGTGIIYMKNQYYVTSY